MTAEREILATLAEQTDASNYTHGVGVSVWVQRTTDDPTPDDEDTTEQERAAITALGWQPEENLGDGQWLAAVPRHMAEAALRGWGTTTETALLVYDVWWLVTVTIVACDR